MMGRWVVLFSVCVALASAQSREARLVGTAQGPVRGYRSTQGDHFEFLGIPYATAPSGAHRFKAPLPGPVWLETLEAVNGSIMCPQNDYISLLAPEMVTQENCLLANVYVPDTDKKNLAVLVIVHGGGYQLGYGNQMVPRGLMKNKKIVAVTFNYRLGVHGFLCLGTKDVPGNAGMKDQVALLRWVKKNIGKFGGNPNDVTITGSSAGGSAVDLLMLSQMARDHFNKVIPESGSNVAPWSVQINPLENAKELAKNLGFENVDDVYALEEFYKNAPYDVLTKIQDRKDSTFGFSPCVERGTGAEIFLDDSPVNIIKQGKYKKVPVLYGFANLEGMLRLFQFDIWKDDMNTRFSDFLPLDLQFDSDEQKEQVAKEAKQFYFGDKVVGEETVLNYIDYFSDVIFVYPALRSTSLQAAAGSKSIYLYEYSYPVDLFPSYFKPPGEIPEFMLRIRGARHAAQTDAVLDSALETPRQLPEEYRRHRELMQDLWLNFISTGKPGSADAPGMEAWTPADERCAPHASLGERMEVRGPLLETRRRFWDSVYERHYRQPVPPPAPPLRHSEL